MSPPIFQHLTVCFTQIDVDESLQCYRTFTLIGRNNKTVQQHVDSEDVCGGGGGAVGNLG